MVPSWHLLAFYKKMQIISAITKNHTFANILKKESGMKSVYIHVFSWSMNAITIKPALH